MPMKWTKESIDQEFARRDPVDDAALEGAARSASATALLSRVLDSALPTHSDVARRIISESRRRPVLRMLLVLAPVAAAAAVAGVLVTGFGPSKQVAFAGWSATPTTPAAGQVSAAKAICLADANQDLQSQRPTSMQHKLLGTPEGTFEPVVIDTRGPYTLVVMRVTGTVSMETAACLTGPGDLATHPRLSTATGKDTPPPASDAVGTFGWGHTGNGTRPGAETVILGTVGATVTSVTLTLTDGTKVTATVANGVCAAWWPGSTNPYSAVASTVTGKSTTHLFTSSAPPPGTSEPTTITVRPTSSS